MWIAQKTVFTSYDAHALLGYQYLAASFDGAGWLPLASFDAEVDAMLCPMKRALAQNPDCLCGQIIFQKDGYNMARRSPVAQALPKQLALLQQYGYRVVTVSELLSLPVCGPLARKPGLCAREGAAGGRLVHLLPRQYRPPGANSNPRGAVHVCLRLEDGSAAHRAGTDKNARLPRRSLPSSLRRRHRTGARARMYAAKRWALFPDEPVSPEDFFRLLPCAVCAGNEKSAISHHACAGNRAFAAFAGRETL